MTGFDTQASDIRPNTATYIVRLVDWDLREKDSAQLRREMQAIADKSADSVSVTTLPASIRGLGSTNGFTGFLQARGNDDPAALKQVTDDFMAALAARPELTSLRTLLRANIPMLRVELDEDKAMRLGISTSQVYDTLSTLLPATTSMTSRVTAAPIASSSRVMLSLAKRLKTSGVPGSKPLRARWCR